MLTSVDARRRWFGTFFLILAVGMLLWGFTFLGPVLVKNPPLFVGYWLTDLALTIAAFSIAVYDMRVMRARIREERKSAFQRAFGDIIDGDPK